MRSPEGRCLDSLQRAPVALYSESLPLAVLFSPKAGTTFAVKWFFFQEGILDEALAYAKWPHPYRQEVFYQRPDYVKLAAVPSLGPRVVKFVRDPYDRAVSSYLHFCELSQRDDPNQARVVLADIGDHLGRPVGIESSFTFREFVSYLASIDLRVANVHFRTQVSPCERDGLLQEMRIVRIEESRDELPRLEADLGLKASDYEKLRRSPHDTTRADLTAFFGDTALGFARDVPTPRTESFYDEALIQRSGDCMRKIAGPMGTVADPAVRRRASDRTVGPGRSGRPRAAGAGKTRRRRRRPSSPRTWLAGGPRRLALRECDEQTVATARVV